MTAVDALEPGLLVEGEARPAGPCGGKPAPPTPPSTLAGGGGDPGDCGGPGSSGGADGGKHRGPHPGRRPCPTCLRPIPTGPSPSRSRATGGSGLGLYLVRMIVEAPRRDVPHREQRRRGGASPPSFRASPQKTHKFSPLSSHGGPVSLGRTQTRKDAVAMQITLQELNMTYPNGKKALQG